MRIPVQCKGACSFRLGKSPDIHAVMIFAAAIGLARHHTAHESHPPARPGPLPRKVDQTILADAARSDDRDEDSAHMTRRPCRHTELWEYHPRREPARSRRACR